LPGESLWKDALKRRGIGLRRDNPKSSKTSPGCSKFLAGSEKARRKWSLEKAFAQFEAVRM